MDSVCAGGEGDVGAGVDDEFGRWVSGVGAEGCEEAAGERGEGADGEIVFSELEEVDAGSGEALGLDEERGLAGGFVSLETGAVGDGVTKHGF